MTLPRLRFKHIRKDERIKILMSPGNSFGKWRCFGDISAVMEEHEPRIKEEFFGRMFSAIGPAPDICYYILRKASGNLPPITKNALDATFLDYLNASLSGEKFYKRRIVSDLSAIETENPLFFNTTMHIFKHAGSVDAFTRCAEETAMIYNLLSRNMELVPATRLPVSN